MSAPENNVSVQIQFDDASLFSMIISVFSGYWITQGFVRYYPVSDELLVWPVGQRTTQPEPNDCGIPLFDY